MPLPRLPGFVASIGRRLPQAPPTLALVGALETARRLGWLRDDDRSPLAGRRFEVEVRDAGLRCRFRYGNAGFRPDAGPPDVAFRADAETFVALLLRAEDPDTLFFQRRLVIEGDTELGLTVKNLLDAVDWDAIAARVPLGREILRLLAPRSAAPGQGGFR